MASVEGASDLNAPLMQNEVEANYTEKPIETFYAKEIKESKCCCFNIAYYPAARIRLCNHWIVKPFKPIMVSIIFLVCYFSCLYNIIAFKEEGKPLSPFAITAISISTLIFIFLVVSYFGVIVRGPGYLPFDYSVNHKTNLTWDEQKLTFAIYKQEVHFARNSSRPPRSSFSILARRFVLRADHYCVWTESWIGLKNHRYFLLMTLYALLFSVGYVCSNYWHIIYIKDKSFKDVNKASVVIAILISAFMLCVVILSAKHFFGALKNLYHNKTGIEIYKESVEKRHLPYSFDRGCFNNFSEVCGPKKCCPVWWIPLCCLNPTIDGLYTNFRPPSLYEPIQA